MHDDELRLLVLDLGPSRWKLIHHVHHTWHCCDANMNCDADVVVYDKELHEYLCQNHYIQIALAIKELDAIP